MGPIKLGGGGGGHDHKGFIIFILFYVLTNILKKLHLINPFFHKYTSKLISLWYLTISNYYFIAMYTIR